MQEYLAIDQYILILKILQVSSKLLAGNGESVEVVKIRKLTEEMTNDDTSSASM
jgi:hypothetical protein